LRGAESRRDYEFVKALSRKLALPFEGRALKAGELKGHGESPQAMAREARYAFLEGAARTLGAVKVALGHTRDDLAETVLMRFIKGSGPGGLKGMAPVRGVFVRPLIDIDREEVERFVEESGIEYVEDSSNQSTRYLRNALRLDLIPFIKERYNPNILKTLTRTALVLGRDDECLNRWAEDVYADTVTAHGVQGGEGAHGGRTIILDRLKLLNLHPAVSTRVFLKAAGVLGKRGELYACHINQFLEIIKGGRPNATLMLPGGLRCLREYDMISLSTDATPELKPFDRALEVPGHTGVEEAGLVISATILDWAPGGLGKGFGPLDATAFFDYDRIPKPVYVRSPRPGDSMVPMGMQGHKKLKDIFIDKKVSASRRARTPILYAGNTVIWAVGLRQSDCYKVLDSTVKVLKIECSPVPAGLTD
jgi:tRNA(Ile)-lysidine synthase